MNNHYRDYVRVASKQAGQVVSECCIRGIDIQDLRNTIEYVDYSDGWINLIIRLALCFENTDKNKIKS